MSTDDVLSAIESLKPGKTDSDHVSSYHLKYAVPVIVESISSFFTAILHHGYTVEPPIKDTPNKGHNRKNLSIKDTL